MLLISITYFSPSFLYPWYVQFHAFLISYGPGRSAIMPKWLWILILFQILFGICEVVIILCSVVFTIWSFVYLHSWGYGTFSSISFLILNVLVRLPPSSLELKWMELVWGESNFSSLVLVLVRSPFPVVCFDAVPTSRILKWATR